MTGVDKVRTVIGIIGKFFFFYIYIFFGRLTFWIAFLLYFREKIKAGRENLRFSHGVFAVF